MRASRLLAGVMMAGLILGVSGTAYGDDDDRGRPGFLRGEILRSVYDGLSDDLLTGGLGKAGLAGAAPGFADPTNPTAAELRRLAIYNNYRALVEGRHSRLRYYEVLNAQHLDALDGFAGFNERYVPLHHYYIQALDLMLDHLRHGTPLPPSQVVRTTPRGPGAPAITLANLPAVAADPDTGARITFVNRELRIPE